MSVAKHVRTPLIICLWLAIPALINACGQSAAPTTPPPNAAPGGAGGAAPTPQPQISSGQRLYEDNCAACHGQLGEGGKAPDGSITTPLSFHQRGHANIVSTDGQIMRAVLDGVNEEDGRTRELSEAMPRFRGKLSEAEVAEIISYMKTLP